MRPPRVEEHTCKCLVNIRMTDMFHFNRIEIDMRDLSVLQKSAESRGWKEELRNQKTKESYDDYDETKRSEFKVWTEVVGKHLPI